MKRAVKDIVQKVRCRDCAKSERYREQAFDGHLFMCKCKGNVEVGSLFLDEEKVCSKYVQASEDHYEEQQRIAKENRTFDGLRYIYK